tara:strand:- start:9253 stop:9837 length:585 start_codon:yes stop_codon:yes gene_type:complete
MKIIIRKKFFFNIYFKCMDNIIDTFNINKEIINKDEILNTKPNNDEDIVDIILKKKKLIEMAVNLTVFEYNEILSIIQEDSCNYSSNTNGVFINLSNVEDKTIDRIYNFLKYTKHKKEELKQKESYLEDFKKTIQKDDGSNLFNNNNNNNDFARNDDKSVESLSDNDDTLNYNDYLCFSSDDDEEKKVLKNKKK